MDIIRTYLDNMFLALPETPETLRAKQELSNMMEDKYNELKAAGKTENEAIGVVITEFGNLDELAAELHLKRSQNTDGGWEQAGYTEGPRLVGADEAEDYLAAGKKTAGRTALGTLFCIISPSILIYLTSLSSLRSSRLSENIASTAGLMGMFLLVGAAVTLFITGSAALHPYDYLKKEEFRLEFGTLSYLQELRGQFRSAYTVQITVGVMLCIFSIMPLIFVGTLYENNEFLQSLTVCLLFFMVGAGVFLFVQAGMISNCYKVLLDSPENVSGSTPYIRRRKRKTAVMKAIDDIFWLLATALYLGVSFYTMKWQITWIIWPIAGILHAIVQSVCKAISAAGGD